MKLKTDIASLSEWVMKKHRIPEVNAKKALAIQYYMHTVREAAVEPNIDTAMQLMKRLIEGPPSFNLDHDSHFENHGLFHTICGWYRDEQFLSVLDRYIEEGLKEGNSESISSALYYFKRCKFDEYVNERLEHILAHAIKHDSLPILNALESFSPNKDMKSERDDFQIRVFSAKIAVEEKKNDIWNFLYELDGYPYHSHREHVRILLAAIDRVIKIVPVPTLVEYARMVPKHNYTQSSNYFDKAHEGPAVLSIIELMERKEKG